MKKLLFILCVLVLSYPSFAQKNQWIRLDTAANKVYFDGRSLAIGLVNFNPKYYHKYFYSANSNLNNCFDKGYSLGTMYDNPLNVLSNMNIVKTHAIPLNQLNIMGTFDPLRSQYLAMLKYSSNKILFGSYKSFIPDYSYYQLWENMLTQKYPKFMSIKDKDSVMAIAMDSFNLFYEKHSSSIGNFKYTAEFHYMGKNSPRDYTDFSFPQFINNDEVLTIKTTYTHNPRLIMIDANADEHIIKDATGFWDNYFAYRNKKIYWSEKQIDKHGNEFGNIYSFDYKRRKSTKLTTRLLYHFPNPSEEGYYIVAVRTGKNYDYLCQLDAKSGIEETIIDSTYKYSYPSYTFDGKDIYVVATDTNGRNAMLKINVKSFAKTTIADFTYHKISSIHVGRKFLYFDASFNGLNNIYCFDLLQKKIVTVTNRLSGCYQASSNEGEDKLLFTEYTHVGKNLMVVNVIEYDKWRKVEKIVDIPEFRPHFYSWIEQYKTTVGTTTKKYKTAKPSELYYNTFQIIAQRPMGSIVYNRSSLLKNTNLIAGLTINRGEKSISPSVAWSKTKGHSEFGVGYSFITTRTQPKGRQVLQTHDVSFRYQTYTSRFAKGYQHYQFFQFKPGYNINTRYSFPYLELNYNYKIAQPLCHGNIYSNHALNIGLTAVQDLKGVNGISRYHVYAEGIQKMPLKVHLISKLGYMSDNQVDLVGYYYNFMLNRGNYYMVFSNAYYLNLEGAFPIAFLDYSYHKWLYIKSIRGSIFFDAAIVSHSGKNRFNNSQGIEVYTELYLCRAFKLNLGLRVAKVQNFLSFGRNGIVVQPIIPNYTTNL
ncbi:MAG: hypothetical protein SGJ10_01310 [Bacteroidota bacterium]|nr:hypothetical protein [Bacteroidota bacterium]